MVVILDPQAEPGVPIDAYDVFANVRRRGVSIALVSNGS
jgi:hypothetical protein